MILSALAPAKVNLYLHITGKRADGYHLLESLVAFTDIGDRITLSPAPELSLTVSGTFGHLVPNDSNNILLKTAQRLAMAWDMPTGLHIDLEKNIPVGAGLGGGSADAAALMKLLCHYWHKHVTATELAQLGLPLGADIPIMLEQKPAFMSGIGDIIHPFTGPDFQFPAVIIYPHIAVSTIEVYKRSVPSFRAPEYHQGRPTLTDNLLPWLIARHNDLEHPARHIAPAIPGIIDALRHQDGCQLARMSGSGSACFGIFASEAKAQNAVTTLQQHFPDAWIRYTRIGSVSSRNA